MIFCDTSKVNRRSFARAFVFFSESIEIQRIVRRGPTTIISAAQPNPAAAVLCVCHKKNRIEPYITIEYESIVHYKTMHSNPKCYFYNKKCIFIKTIFFLLPAKLQLAHTPACVSDFFFFLDTTNALFCLKQSVFFY